MEGQIIKGGEKRKEEFGDGEWWVGDEEKLNSERKMLELMKQNVQANEALILEQEEGKAVGDLASSTSRVKDNDGNEVDLREDEFRGVV